MNWSCGYARLADIRVAALVVAVEDGGDLELVRDGFAEGIGQLRILTRENVGIPQGILQTLLLRAPDIVCA